MPRHTFNSRAYGRWCRHPEGVSLLARMEVVFSCTFDEPDAARRFSAHMLSAGQRIQFRKHTSLVQISAVMVPSDENINGFAQTLAWDTTRFGGATQKITEQRNIFTPPAPVILTTYAFGSADHACQAAIALLESAQVQLALDHRWPRRYALLVCVPSHSRCVAAQDATQDVESVVRTYDGTFLSQGHFAL